jgi:hypothetical protein
VKIASSLPVGIYYSVRVTTVLNVMTDDLTSDPPIPRSSRLLPQLPKLNASRI